MMQAVQTKKANIQAQRDSPAYEELVQKLEAGRIGEVSGACCELHTVSSAVSVNTRSSYS